MKYVAAIVVDGELLQLAMSEYRYIQNASGLDHCQCK